VVELGGRFCKGTPAGSCAAGFIRHHLITYLKEGHWVRGVDVNYLECTEVNADEVEILDPRQYDSCVWATGESTRCFRLPTSEAWVSYRRTTPPSAQHFPDRPPHAGGLAYEWSIQASLHVLRLCESLITSSSRPRRPPSAGGACLSDPQDAYGWEMPMAEQGCQRYNEESGLVAVSHRLQRELRRVPGSRSGQIRSGVHSSIWWTVQAVSAGTLRTSRARSSIRSEQRTHNPLVAGSSPAGPTV
jgi:nucleoside-diphosphate-sugar epimerase